MPSKNNPSEPTSDSQRWLVIFAPASAIGVITELFIVAIGSIGWQQTKLIIGAIGGGLVIATLVAALLYAQVKRRQAGLNALHNIQARVFGIVESAMDPIITIDEQQRIILFNQAAEKVFRWPRQAVMNQSLEMLMPERFHETHRKHVEHFGATGVTSRRMGATIVLMGMRANGEEFPIEASISQHQETNQKLFTVIMRDVTERVRAEELLAQSEARLSNILDSAMDAIITVDQQQHIVFFNQAAEAVFGCPHEQAIGAPLAWFIPDRFRAEHSEHIRRFGEAGTGSRRMGAQRIVTGLRRNGEEFPIDASISQIDEKGNKFYTVILRDVTERVQAEEALRHSKVELQEMALAAHSGREQEKTRIARELHDELGQGLTALKMDLAWLKEKSNDVVTDTKLISMVSILDSLVAATRRISADLRPLILDDLGLIPALEWLSQTFKERTGILCQLTVSTPEPDLHDPYATAVFRIVQESLNNITKHAQASRVEVSIEQSGSVVTLLVRDDGIGFSQQDQDKPNSYGLLGLRERATLLGGKAQINSVLGHGTTIKVQLPLQPELMQ